MRNIGAFAKHASQHVTSCVKEFKDADSPSKQAARSVSHQSPGGVQAAPPGHAPCEPAAQVSSQQASL
jgi:hypothetical protein